MLVDTHTHLFLPEFDKDRHEAVERAVQKGVRTMFLPNIDRGSIGPMLTLADAFPNHCYPTIGLHPSSVDRNYKKELRMVEKWLKKRTFYAIGETGIDLYWDKTYLKEQILAFKDQIWLAKEYRLPIIIHSRESVEEIFSVLDELNDDRLTGIFHSFTGTVSQAERIIGYGFKIGIGGIVTFKNSGLAEVVQAIEPKHIVLETDSPYLAPVPRRGHRNESSYLVFTAQKIAEVYGMTIEDISMITTKNALEIYGLKSDRWKKSLLF